jgi:hypothetical protein
VAFEQDVIRAYEDVFGRTPSQQEIAHQVAVQGITEFTDYDSLVKGLSRSPEAQNRGVDPTEFGNVIAVPDTLSEEQRSYYDVALEFNDPSDIFIDDIQTWTQFGGDPSHYRAELSGQVLRPVRFGADGTASSSPIYTPEAIETMGGSFVQTGFDTGTSVVLPAGANVTGDYWKKVDSFEIRGDPDIPDGSYDVLVAEGAPSGGLFGAIADFTGIKEIEEFGHDLNKAITSELALATPVLALTPLAPVAAAATVATVGDPLGITQGILFGDAGRQRTLNAYENIGINEESASEIMGIGTQLTSAILAATPGGLPAAFAVQAANVANIASVEGAEFGFGEALPELGRAVVSTFGDQFLGPTGTALAFAGLEAVRGGDTTDILLAGGQSIAGNQLSSEGVAGFIGRYGVDVGADLIRGTDLDDALRQGAINSAISTFADAIGEGITAANQQSAFDEMTPAQRLDFISSGGQVPEETSFVDRVTNQFTGARGTGALFSDPGSIPGNLVEEFIGSPEGVVGPENVNGVTIFRRDADGEILLLEPIDAIVESARNRLPFR